MAPKPSALRSLSHVLALGALGVLLVPTAGLSRNAGACAEPTGISPAYVLASGPVVRTVPPLAIDINSVDVLHRELDSKGSGCIPSKCSGPTHELRVTFAPPFDADTNTHDLGYRLEFANYEHEAIAVPVELTPIGHEEPDASAFLVAPLPAEPGTVVLALYDSLSTNLVRLTPVDRQGNYGPPSRWFAIP